MGRRMLISPEINRSKHKGGGGVHISGLEQERCGVNMRAGTLKSKIE